MSVRVYMEIDGEAKKPASYLPEQEVVKLWEAFSPEHMGPPQPVIQVRQQSVGLNILDVVERLPNGMIRRTWWRLPET